MEVVALLLPLALPGGMTILAERFQRLRQLSRHDGKGMDLVFQSDKAVPKMRGS
jgi:hypothetical protein